MRTYTVEFVYDVTLDAGSVEEAERRAYAWHARIMDNPDKELPDDVWSVRTMPQFRTVFVGAEKEVDLTNG
jgi:hypothetical protein